MVRWFWNDAIYIYARFSVNVRSALASCVSIQYFFKNLLECYSFVDTYWRFMCHLAKIKCDQTKKSWHEKLSKVSQASKKWKPKAKRLNSYLSKANQLWWNAPSTTNNNLLTNMWKDPCSGRNLSTCFVSLYTLLIIFE